MRWFNDVWMKEVPKFQVVAFFVVFLRVLLVVLVFRVLRAVDVVRFLVVLRFLLVFFCFVGICNDS